MNKDFREFLIDELRQIKEMSKDIRYGYEAGVNDSYAYILKKYDEFHKPVVIPDFVAEWIEEVKDREWTLYGAMSECPREVDYWLIDGDCSNQDTFARAWLDGYTVEKEQKYYARIKGWELFADFVGVQYWGIVSIYGRIGFVSADDAKDNTKDEWKRLGIDDSNAEFVEVV